MNWIHLLEDRDRWWVLVNTAMVMRLHKILEILGQLRNF
jgi:hypothetical protein